jgi:hypothetical protein
MSGGELNLAQLDIIGPPTPMDVLQNRLGISFCGMSSLSAGQRRQYTPHVLMAEEPEKEPHGAKSLRLLNAGLNAVENAQLVA